jgi:hypothetical protein
MAEQKYGCTPLHWAASSGNLALCQCLCSAGADPTAQDFNGYDSFVYAKQSTSDECLNYLISVMQSFSRFTAPLAGSQGQSYDDGRDIHVPNVDLVKMVEQTDVVQKNELSKEIRCTPESEMKNDFLIVRSPRGDQTTQSEEGRQSRANHTLEEELLSHLRIIERKLNHNEDANSNDRFLRSGEQISELSNKLLQAQADLSSKNMEIMAMSFELKTLHEKYDSLASKTRPLVTMVDKSFGESNLSLNEEVSTTVPFLFVSDTTKGEISDLKNMLQSLEQENSRLKKEQTQEEFKSNEEWGVMRDEIDRLRVAGALKDQEIVSLRENLTRLQDLSVQSDDDTESNMERLLLTTEQYKEQLARSMDEIAALRHSHQGEILSLNKELDSYSKTIEELHEKCTLSNRKIVECERTLCLEKDSKIELEEKISALHARQIEDVIKEKDTLIHKWKREFVMLEDRNDVTTRELEECRKKLTETEIKLQESVKLVHEAKAALAANERLHRLLQMETDKRKVLHNKLEDMKGRIRVYVRIRPISEAETKRGFKCALSKDENKVNIISPDDSNESRFWDFDRVFGGNTAEGNNQAVIFQDTSYLMTSVVDGYNVCIVAYGQTGTIFVI